VSTSSISPAVLIVKHSSIPAMFGGISHDAIYTWSPPLREAYRLRDATSRTRR
jgi:hypothetical protein